MTHRPPPCATLPASPTSPAHAPGVLCEHEHAALKSSDEQWPTLPFAGIQPLGRELFDSRHCPFCGSTVARVVTLTRALELLLEDLVTISPPRPSTARSASLLTQWVAQNVQPALGHLAPAASTDAQHARSR